MVVILYQVRMSIRVIADTETDFKKWTNEQLEPAVASGSPLFEKGKKLFEEQTCTNCHAINGTEYNADIGPNLTHLQVVHV